MSAISHLTNQELDLDYIWKNEKVQPQLEEIIERLVVKVNNQLDLDNSRSFTKNSKCWDDIQEMINTETIPNSLQLSSNNNLDFYTEVEKNIIEQANAISQEYWKAVLEWDKKEKALAQIEKRAILNYIKKFDKGRFFKTINNAEKALKIKEEVESMGFCLE